MQLKINKDYTNEEVRKEFKCSLMSGMNYSKKTNTLVLIRKHIDNIYDDQQEGDILYYTGQGLKGNQELKAANKRLLNSKIDGTQVYLFEVFSKSAYTFKGEVELIKKPFLEKQNDSVGNKRNVYIFPLRILDSRAITDFEKLEKVKEKKQKRVSKISDQKLEKMTKESEKNKPGYSYSKVKVYQRSEYVVESVLRRSNGKCELCEEDAPFYKKNGKPCLEVHHIIQLAHGGSDKIDNAAALCPNCHRKIHNLKLKTDIKKLKKTAKL